ncbi:MAG: FtsX-like permease family protein [Candidatus Aminicenantaceae bacterium]
MKIRDYVEFSLSNLWKRKLRTFLTTCGVVIGIGALVAMVSFGKGIQRNVLEGFQTLELFNFITVFSGSFDQFIGSRSGAGRTVPSQSAQSDAVPLDDTALTKIGSLPGVEMVFPDIRFPAQVRLGEEEEFTFVQALPAKFATTELVQLRTGRPLAAGEEDMLIISDSLLRRLGVRDYAGMIGEEITVSTLALDLSGSPLADLASVLGGGRLPFKQEPYLFTIGGVSERMGFGGPSLLRSDVIISADRAANMDKLAVTNLSDLFRVSDRLAGGYAMVNVKLSSPQHVDVVKARIEDMGFETFALIDQLEEIKSGFVFMDMFLLAVGMIAIMVASLGIMNTMIMSILERYSEIGIMKAVGAGDRDIQKIFIFESCVIGLAGGVLGLALGWIVSRIINQIANYFLARQGVPFIEYFNFPWWICLGSIGFAVAVSLVSGIYPAARAARVDPVVALRHD